eukprot:Nk52_evm32s236 gene=Nk52_evmTU32s236
MSTPPNQAMQAEEEKLKAKYGRLPNAAKRLQKGHERKFFDSGDYMMCKSGASTEYNTPGGEPLPTKVVTKEDLHTQATKQHSHLTEGATTANEAAQEQ